MKETRQAAEFYAGLTDEEREDLTEAIAEHIIFLDEELQKKVAELLGAVDSGLGAEIMKRNNFTM